MKQRIRQLKQIAEWNRRGQWKPLIAIACKKYGVSAAGLHRMMMLESGGRRTVGSGPYKGLFQYYPSTWTRELEPLAPREHLQRLGADPATAYVISSGMGPSQWPNTYPMAF